MKLITARDIFRDTLKDLYSTNEAYYYFKMILSSLFEIEPISIALEPDLTLKSGQKKKLQSLMKDLLSEKPLQYLLGEIYFRSVRIKVNPLVLIPRPETEELVGWVLEDFSRLKRQLTLIDLGTGSGCIAIALKKEQPLFKVHALDLDQDILDLVSLNADANKQEVSCIKSDITDLEKFKLQVDIIISNPPYLLPKEKVNMKKNVLKYEPHQALFVPQGDPLIFYRNILIYAEENLKSKGKIYFEINPLCESEIENLILSFNSYNITKRLDIFGKLRMLRLEKL